MKDGGRRALSAAVVLLLAGLAFLLFWLGHDSRREPNRDERPVESLLAEPVREPLAEKQGSKTVDAGNRETVATHSTFPWTLRVLDEANREPVAGARVHASVAGEEVEALSATDGTVSLALPVPVGSAPDPVDVLVDHPLFVRASVPSVRPTEPRDVLLRRAGELIVLLRPPPSGPATVILFEQIASAEKGWPSHRVEAADHARFSQLVPGDYALTASAPGVIAQSLRGLRVRAGESRDVTLELAPESVLHGRLLTSDGVQPIANAGVHLTITDRADSLAGAPEVDAGVTGQDGRFEARGLLPAAYRLRFVPRGGLPFHGSITVHKSGEELHEEFHAPATMRVLARVVDTDKRPVTDATVAVFASSEWADVLKKATDGIDPAKRPVAKTRADGTFEINAPADASSTVYVAIFGPDCGAHPLCADWHEVTRTLLGDSSREGTDVDLGELVFAPPRIVAGKVVDPEKSPVPDAVIDLVAGYGDQVLSTVDCERDGSFRLTLSSHDDGPLRGGRIGARAPGLVGKRMYLNSKLPDPLVIVLHRSRTVTGTVVDAAGRAVPNLDVMLGTQLPDHKLGPRPGGGDATARSDELGRFQFVDVVAMESEITLPPSVRNEWRLLHREPETIAADSNAQVSLTVEHPLRTESATLRGRLVLPKGLDAVTGLRMWTTSQDRSVPRTSADALSQDGDAFTLRDVAPGRIVLTIICRECGEVERRIELMPGESFDVGDVELKRVATLIVHLTDAKDQPITDATLSVTPADGGRRTDLLSRPKGVYLQGQIPCEQAYDLRVHRPGHEDHVERIDVPAQSQVELRVRVE
jgi:hypothetical protein